ARVYLLAPRVRVPQEAPVPALGPLREETWAVIGESGDLLMPAHLRNEPGVIQVLVENLEKRARYRLALDLANDNSALKGKVEAELFRWVGASLEKPELGPDSRPIFYEGDSLGLKVTNRSNRPLFIYVLDLGLTGRISLVHPNLGVEDSLKPGHTLEVGTLSPDSDLELFIPDEYPFAAANPGEPELEGHESLKIIATTHPTDFYPLFQSGMRGVASSLTSLLEATFGGGGYSPRDARIRSRSDDAEDWVALDRSLRLRRRRESRLALGARGV
ncbi:MAG TPA: hypothetical protein VIW92_00390, partial [Thermoanaerobaculia bacterium]